MPWKEEFDQLQSRNADVIKAFIQSKFSELINSIPDKQTSVTDRLFVTTNLKPLKDQLRKEWL